ncbi:chorion peroxidase-like, partial [Orbicella faveolata]|uniref:chorion peroxidase-like n=1 Tax=Orbicella faveolata TaxID=48498 RepID=UPI0009E3F8B4
FCRSSDLVNEPCFRAGDPRVNENQALMAMHALWVREHNRIAKLLHLLNPWYNDEKLFQEARRIVGAMIQHITYNEWLPALIPSQTLRQEAGVALEAPGTFFDGYDPFVKCVMFNEFSTAGLRIGHTLIRETFTLADGVRRVDRLNESAVDFFDPAVLYELNLGVNPYTGLYLGLALERAFEFDRYVFIV